MTRASGKSWAPVNLEPFLDGRGAPKPPSKTLRSDGVALLYPGRLHSIHGEPEVGKSFFAAEACTQEAAAGGNAVVIDLEDHPANWVKRLQALGTTTPDLLNRFSYVAPSGPLNEEGWNALTPALSTASLVVVDSTSEAMALHGLNLSDNSDVARWMQLVRRLGSYGAAVLVLDHVTKDKESRGRYAIGGQAKLAAVDVAFSVHSVERWSQERSGSSSVRLEKDRAGHLRSATAQSSDEVALMRVSPAPNGAVELSLDPPSATAHAPAPLDDYMERVSRALEAEPRRGMRAVRSAVDGDNGKVDAALRQLVAEGFAAATRDGQAFMFSLVRPYRVLRAAPEGAAARSTLGAAQRASGASTPEARQHVDPARPTEAAVKFPEVPPNEPVPEDDRGDPA